VMLFSLLRVVLFGDIHAKLEMAVVLERLALTLGIKPTSKRRVYARQRRKFKTREY
jgi:hypothetical protein